LALVVLVLSALLLLGLAPGAWRSWQVYAGTGQRRQEDATADPVEPSASVQGRSAALAALGYRSIGKTKLALPDHIAYAWIDAAEDARSYAIVVESPSLVTGIYTAWSDGTWLGTMHPRGGATERAGLRIRVVGTTLADAVRLHREGVEQLRAVHGEPRPVRAMPDMLALDADYRERFGNAGLGSITVRVIVPALVAAVLVVIALAQLLLPR
jgi:hypothetical protein